MGGSDIDCPQPRFSPGCRLMDRTRRFALRNEALQQVTQGTMSTGIGNGAPSSAGSFSGAQHALVNLDKSASMVLSLLRTERVSVRMRAAPACFGTMIL